MNRVLLVVRDIMSARITLPVVETLRYSGVDVVIIAEGKAVEIIEAAGLPLLAKGDDTLTPFLVSHRDPRAVLRETSPDVLLIGTSSPINWEQEFGIQAQDLRISVVAFCDIWGGLSRFSRPLVPDLAFVIDEYEAGRVVAEGSARHVHVIGDIASMVSVDIPPAMAEQEKRLRALNRTRSTVLAVGDSTDNALEVVDIISKSIRLCDKPDSFVVIPRLIHPKFAHEPVSKTIVSDAEILLEGISVERLEGLATDAIAARATYTVTSFSTPLRTALHHGKRAISIQGPLSLALLVKETGTDDFPLLSNGAVAIMAEPTAITAFDWDGIDRSAREWARRSKFNPGNAVTALRKLVVARVL